jgi:MFS family permease
MTFYHPINQLSILVCILLALATVAIPFSDTLQSNIASKLTAFFLLALFEYLSSFALTIAVLKVSDSVSPELRESAMRWSAGLCGLARAGGSVGGPALFAAALTGVLGTDYHWLFVGVAGALLGVAALMICDKRRFPRLNESPYEV